MALTMGVGGTATMVAACTGSWTSHSSAWQWRHNTSFSRMKNNRMPNSTVAVIWAGSFESSSASGNALRKAAPSSASMAYEISICTHDVRVLSVSAAANSTLNVPPNRLVTMIQARIDIYGEQMENARL